MPTKQDKWREAEKKVIALTERQVLLINDMVKSVKELYSSASISDYRVLCIGYLTIAKSNIEASILLISNNFVNQVHYINRNMFDMIATLYYISDIQNDKNLLSTRFFEHSSVVAKKALDTIKKYPERFSTIRMRTPVSDAEVEKEYNAYKEKHGKGRDTWSGKTIPDMISELTDEKEKKVLTEYYDTIVKINNWYLHPTTTYLREVITTGENIINHEYRVMMLDTVFQSAVLLIAAFLKEFSKGRIAFRKRFAEISSAYSSLVDHMKEHT